MQKRIGFAVLALPLALAACGAYQPFEYQHRDNEMSGPGLFSGKEGEFVIYKSSHPTPEPEKGRTPEPSKAQP